MSLTHNNAVRRAIFAVQRAGGRAWRRDVGLFYDQRGTLRRIGTKGEADVQGILPGGRAIAIEVKTGNGRRTVQQRAWAAAWERLGGLYVVARYNDSTNGDDKIRAALESL